MLLIAIGTAAAALRHRLFIVAHAMEHRLAMLIDPLAYRSGMCCFASCPGRIGQ